MLTAKELGERIQEARVAAGLSRSKLAELLYFSRDSVWGRERGLCFPTVPTVAELCVHLNVSPAWLLGLEGEK